MFFYLNEADNFRKWCFEVHDNQVNQKYGDAPYSTHLKYVASQAARFKHLLTDDEFRVAEPAAYGHDLIEDGRQSYNDIRYMVQGIYLSEPNVGQLATDIADTIYCVTDEKGKKRGDRKNDKFYEELNANHLAVYVKLCDMAANTLFSLLNNSGMYAKYKAEFPTFKAKTAKHYERFQELYDYVENI